MKHGKSNAPDTDFAWWVLPDKPRKVHIGGMLGSVAQQWSTTQPDWDAVNEQQQRFREVLGRSCKGEWMETNNRYFFKLEEDYEMFLIMLNLVA